MQLFSLFVFIKSKHALPFVVSQMDNDKFVPIATVARFNQVKRYFHLFNSQICSSHLNCFIIYVMYIFEVFNFWTVIFAFILKFPACLLNFKKK